MNEIAKWTLGFNPIKAILFDKDGTIVDFQRTWGPAVNDVMQQMADGRPAIYQRLASASGFAEVEQGFLSDSLLIAHPIGVWGPLWAGALGCEASPAFLTDLDRRLQEATTTHLKPIGDPGKLLAMLARRGYQLGVFSNNSEIAVRSHLRKLGIENMFCFFTGYNSEFGAKPDPGQVIAFAKAAGVCLSRTAVVGDTVLDLAAARAAGAVAIGVLTGLATAATLSPVADIILASIDDIPTWVTEHRKRVPYRAPGARCPD